MLVCRSCGQENPDVARFCLACATPFAEVSPRREERKLVTVLFADVVGFTSRAEELDPEDVRALLAPYWTHLKGELERHGGTVEKFIGDAVVALFGAPVAHEDDPERAVRAALAIRDWIVEQGGELQVRVAVTTGEALVALGAKPGEGEGMASGDVLNTAARLQAAAPANGILVGEATYRATRGLIEYRQAEPVLAKGKTEPVPVWEALAARSAAHAPRAYETPLIGRERELSLLVEALTRAVDDQAPQLVTVVGVPGIGKSRLLFELEQQAREVDWHRGRCLPYGDGVTFWPLGEIVKAACGIRESDSPQRVETQLAAAVEDDWVRGHLRALAGLSSAPAESDRREEAFSAWLRFVETLAAARPLVLVIEDLHWADDAMLDFVDYLVEWTSGVPLLVLATARPELLERRRGWGGGKPNALTLSPAPLSEQETARLVSAVLARPLMDAGRQAQLLAQAGGNPLYAEQLANVVLERGDAEDLPLPETLHGIIAARLDLLAEAEKRVLQDAAVLGRSFWVGALAALAGGDAPDLNRRLHTLERRELVRRQRTSRIEGETEYAFHHALVRDVAYGLLPRRERAEKHRASAQWIEQLGRRDDHVELLAHHYSQALELNRTLGADTTELGENARVALRAAGDRALTLYAYATATRFYDQALELWPPDDRERPELLFQRAKALFFVDDRGGLPLLDEARAALLAIGDHERAAEAEILAALGVFLHDAKAEARERAERAAAELEAAPTSPAKAFVLANRGRLLSLAADPRELVASRKGAIVAGREVLAMAEQLGLQELKANALNTIGLNRVMLDDFGGLDDLEESLRLVLEGSPFELSRTYLNLATAYLAAGRLAAAAEIGQAAVAAARRFGMRSGLRRFRWQQAGIAYLSGQWQEALETVEDLLAEDPDEGGDLMLALIRLGQGDVDGAAAACERVLERERASDPIELPLTLTVAARIALAQGRQQAAEEHVDRLVPVAREALLRGMWPDPPFHLVWLLRDLDRPLDGVLEAAAERPRSFWLPIAADAARGDLLDVADRLEEIGLLAHEAHARQRGAEQLAAEGRRAEAEEQLQRALAFYRSVDARYYIRQAEALLPASA